MTASGGQISAPEWTLTPRPQNQEPNTLAWSCEQARSHARIVPGHTAPLSPSPGLNTLTSLPGPMTLNSTLLNVSGVMSLSWQLLQMRSPVTLIRNATLLWPLGSSVGFALPD